MNECFEKARELGRMILECEPDERLWVVNRTIDIITATVEGELPKDEKHGHCGGCGKH